MREFVSKEEQNRLSDIKYFQTYYMSTLPAPQLSEVTSTVSVSQNTRAAEFLEDIVFD